MVLRPFEEVWLSVWFSVWFGQSWRPMRSLMGFPVPCCSCFALLNTIGHPCHSCSHVFPRGPSLSQCHNVAWCEAHRSWRVYQILQSVDWDGEALKHFCHIWNLFNITSFPWCPQKMLQIYHKAKTSGINRQEEVTSGSQFLVPELAEVDSVEFYPSPSLMTFVHFCSMKVCENHTPELPGNLRFLRRSCWCSTSKKVGSLSANSWICRYQMSPSPRWMTRRRSNHFWPRSWYFATSPMSFDFF